MKKIFTVSLFILLFLVQSCNIKIEQKEAKIYPTPLPGTGGVKGKLIMPKPSDRNGLIVYLGDIIELSNEFSGGFLDTSIAPFSYVDPEDGTFYFHDIKPGTYSLVIYEVVSGGMVYYDENGNVLKIEVKENNVLDLGDVYFSFE
jgi:hypothetical protein